MPNFDVLAALAPDACRTDPSAPCAYFHRKSAALNGHRGDFSPAELEFLGVEYPPSTGLRPPTRS